MTTLSFMARRSLPRWLSQGRRADELKAFVGFNGGRAVMSILRRRRHFALLLVVTGLMISGLVSVASTSAAQRHDSAGQSSGPRWLATWGASPVDMGNHDYSGTIRNIVFTSVGGNEVRIRLSNEFGDQPLQIGAAYVGLGEQDGSIVGANVPLTFSGSSTVTIPQGGEVMSDPVKLNVPPLSDLAVSLYIPTPTEQTGHLDSQSTTYITFGSNEASAPTAAGFIPITSWWFVNGVDVTAQPRVKGTVVAFGDSITDGYQSSTDQNDRWPNDLSRRLQARPGNTLGVVDEGISANEVLSNIAGNPGAGVAGVNRFEQDVVDQPGVKDVILLEGVNDIGNNDTSASALIAGYQQMIAEAHAAGLKIFGGTILPFQGSGYWSAEKEQTRDAVNHWILTSGAFDGVINFSGAMADPSNPQMLNPAYDSGDHLHPNDAGYQVMANAINLKMLLR